MGIKLKEIKQDVAKMPRIPTFLKFDHTRTGCEKAGWYAVAVNDKGLEVLSPLTYCHAGVDGFDKCKEACMAHNIYLGMTEKEVAILWAQRRISPNVPGK